MTSFVRFQSAVPNRHGRFPGVFALANGLAHAHRLSDADHRWWRAANDAATETYTDPSTVDPLCFDRGRHPGARSWFKTTAADLIALTREYLLLLDRYDIAWHELRTSNPGRIVYDDEVQVVAVPHSHADDWPFAHQS